MPFKIASCMWLVMMTKPEGRERKRKKDKHVNYTHTSKKSREGKVYDRKIVNSAKFFNINFKMRSEYNHCI